MRKLPCPIYFQDFAFKTHYVRKADVLHIVLLYLENVKSNSNQNVHVVLSVLSYHVLNLHS